MNLDLSINAQRRSLYNKSFLKSVDADRASKLTAAQKKYAKDRISMREKAKQYNEKMLRKNEALKAQKKIEARRLADAAIGQYRIIEVRHSNGEVTKQSKQTVMSIILEVSAETGIGPEEIKGLRRTKIITDARHEAICRTLARRPDLSLPQIGKAFNRDHTTILHVRDKYGLQRTNTYHKNRKAA